ncbi:MAG TPA: nucleotidyltransferase family protein [Candidatus Acidoferrum sp.]|nr:nucleotidyltransferase family protein [Candidatus Acidoferrum sp.]
MLGAIILAGGESRRMGTPKALVPFRGISFVQHLVNATHHARIGTRRIVLGAGAEEIRDRLAVDPEMIVLNPDWEQGQLASIQAGIRSLPEGIEGMVLCPVDHPLVSANLISNLIHQFDSSGGLIVLPAFRGQRGHPVIFRSSLFAELLAAPPDIGARQVVWAHPNDVEEVPTEEEGVILNLNDPEALKKAVSGGSTK